MHTDQEVIVGLKEGNEAAVETMINLYGNRMLRLALAITGDLQTAEETVQDAFLQVCRKIHGFQGKAAFCTWLYRITMNMAKNKTRVSWFRRVSFLSNDGAIELSGYVNNRLYNQFSTQTYNQPYDEPEIAVLQQETQSDIIRCLRCLPHKYREALVLYYLEEMTIKEIGEVLEQPEGSVKSNLSRGRALLKKELEKRGISSGPL